MVVCTLANADLKQAIIDELRENLPFELDLKDGEDNRRVTFGSYMRNFVENAFERGLSKFIDRANWRVVVPQALVRTESEDILPGCL